MNLVAHAYLCKGTAALVPRLLEALERIGLSTDDLYVRAHDSFGIDEARDLRDRAALRGIGGHRMFVITANSLTSEAQNALLKTLEEPPADATFAFITPAPETLLPTLRSRMQMLAAPGADAEDVIDVDRFLKDSAEARIEALKPLTSAEEKDTAATLSFLSTLERAAARERMGRASISAIYVAREHILDKGALRKPLLENLALALPRIR